MYDLKAFHSRKAICTQMLQKVLDMVVWLETFKGWFRLRGKTIIITDWTFLSNLQTESLSIIHGYDGSSFRQHHINQDFGYRYLPGNFFSFEFPLLLCYDMSLFMLLYVMVLQFYLDKSTQV